MKIKEQEDKLFAELREKNPGITIIPDGVADEEEYLAAKCKIMYVLKEVNANEEDEFDLREFIREGERPQTWDNLARWTEAILNLDEEKPWSDWEKDNDNRRKEYLKKICAINLKKTSGGYTADKKEIGKAASDNSEFLKNQLNIYKPDIDIIICCGTGEEFVHACYQGRKWEETSRGIQYFKDNDTVVISFAHPEARINPCYLHYALVDAVKEIMHK